MSDNTSYPTPKGGPERMERYAAAKGLPRPKRRRVLWLGLVLVELLLMGSAFVGGRLLAEQNRRNARQPFALQLPSQLPKDPVAGSGSVQKISDTVITLSRGRGGAPGGGGAASNQTEVAITAETKYYKNTSSGSPGGPGGGPVQLQVEDATVADVKIGSNVMVWGTKSGERINAQVIYVQSSGR